MQRAEDLGEPLQVAVKGRGGVLGAGGRAKAENSNQNGEKSLRH
jgi:hypothetical protein